MCFFTMNNNQIVDETYPIFTKRKDRKKYTFYYTVLI